ncbi:MAG: GDSL-type esterase/lipase family protein [Bacteroidota bacterium]
MKKAVLAFSLLLNLVLLGYFFVCDSSPSLEEPKPSSESAQGIRDEKGLVVDSVNIVMLGNSITYAGDWQRILDRKDVFNGGKPGWTTQQLSWVIKNFIIPHTPKLCFFKGGINDYTLGIPTERIYGNMTLVLDSINAVGTIPVFTTTLYQKGAFERNRQIDTLNTKMKAFCAAKGYDFVDLRPFLCEDGDIKNQFVQDDNTHLRPEAYPEWAKALRPILKKYGLH